METIIRYGDGQRTRFDVPGSASKTVYVNGVKTATLSEDFQSITLPSAPLQGVPIEIEYDPITEVASLPVDLPEFNILAALSFDEITDLMQEFGPTLNLTTKVNAFVDRMWNRFSRPRNSRAVQGFAIRFPTGNYTLDYLNVYPGCMYRGNTREDTILTQSPTATTDFLQVKARNGKSTNARCPSAFIEHMTLAGNASAYGPGNTPLHGLALEPKESDPGYAANLNYGSVIMHMVKIDGFTGDGYRGSPDRNRPWLSFVRCEGNGGNGLNVTSQADACFIHVGSGGNTGHSILVSTSATFSMVHCEVWASKSAGTGKRALMLNRLREFSITRSDINAAIEVVGGQGVNGDSYDGFWHQGMIAHNTFKFREEAMGDDGAGGWLPLDAYVFVTNCRGVEILDNMFQPPFSRATNTFTVRPNYIVSSSGDSQYTFRAVLTPLSHGMVPYGIDYVNNLSKCALDVTIPAQNTDVGAVHRRIFSNIEFPEVATCGIVAQKGDTARSSLLVGGIEKDTKLKAAGVALTNNTTTNIVGIALTGGLWDVSGSLMIEATGATVASAEACVNTGLSGIDDSDPSSYWVTRQAVTTLTGIYATGTIGPFRQKVPNGGTINRRLNVKPQFSAGTLKASGEIRAVRV